METQGMKKGDKIAVVVYSGHSKAADAVYNYLNDHYEYLQPAPFNGTEFKFKVLSVERRNVPNDNVVELPREEILMKGELI